MKWIIIVGVIIFAPVALGISCFVCERDRVQKVDTCLNFTALAKKECPQNAIGCASYAESQSNLTIPGSIIMHTQKFLCHLPNDTYWKDKLNPVMNNCTRGIGRVGQVVLKLVAGCFCDGMISYLSNDGFCPIIDNVTSIPARESSVTPIPPAKGGESSTNPIPSKGGESSVMKNDNGVYFALLLVALVAKMFDL